MSRRVFRYRDTRVVVGWDRPRQSYFVDIYDLASHHGADEPVYDSMVHGNLRVMRLHEVEEVLAARGITARPRTLAADLLADRALAYPASNVCHDYGRVEGEQP